MIARSIDKLPEMHAHGDYAQQVSAGDNRRETPVEREVQKDGGQEAQHGKTERREHFGRGRMIGGGDQHGQRAHVPRKCQTGSRHR